jgi:hypothetical protein
MARRKALLIGVPEFRKKIIPVLKIVKQDIEILHQALKQSDYNVKIQGINNPLDGTRTAIIDGLTEICSETKSGDTLLIYFSGHGLHYQGKDYLVPSDASLGNPTRFPQNLVPVDFADIIEESKTETILLFIDACREGIDLGLKGSYAYAWGEGKRKIAAKRNFITIFACQKGQYAQYESNPGFSLFTKALGEVLNPKC